MPFSIGGFFNLFSAKIDTIAADRSFLIRCPVAVSLDELVVSFETEANADNHMEVSVIVGGNTVLYVDALNAATIYSDTEPAAGQLRIIPPDTEITVTCNGTGTAWSLTSFSVDVWARVKPGA